MAARIPEAQGRAALAAVRAAGYDADRATTATAVRWTLAELARNAPGHAVEVRVPPYGAVQAVAGGRHTRGTPPNVVEMPAASWLRLAVGDLTWGEGISSGQVRASGVRSDLSAWLPVCHNLDE